MHSFLGAEYFCLSHPPASPGDTVATGTGLAIFSDRVQRYVQIHNKAKELAPALEEKSTPEQISAYEEQLAAAIQRLRRNAKRGDVIPPVVKTELVSIIRGEMQGAGNKQSRETAKVGNPEMPRSTEPAQVALRVNGKYPKNAPLTMMPASVLAKLPKLPAVLEYRFVGRDLILRDTIANIIVDYATQVAPVL